MVDSSSFFSSIVEEGEVETASAGYAPESDLIDMWPIAGTCMIDCSWS